MLRHSILLILLTTVLLAKCQSPKSSFRTLTIGFQYGDEAMSYEELHFKKIGDKIIGSISHSNTDKVLLSDVELNISQTKTIDSFLTLTAKYNTTPCKEKSVSSYVQYYTVIKDSDTIKIYRFCDWQNLTFFRIKQQIFGTYLKSLDIKKVTKSLEYFQVFKGIWKESTPLDKLSLTSVCDLIKTRQDTVTNDYIEFISPGKLVLHRKNRNVYYNYTFQFSGQNTYLQLDAYQNGEEFIYGHSFIIIQSNINLMKLSRGFP
jgi:hypothetical protein